MALWIIVNIVSVLVGATLAIFHRSLIVKVLGLVAVFSGMLYLGGVA